jgi:hypothetical protein
MNQQDFNVKEAAITVALRSPQGMAKLAAVLANPVRVYLDYTGIATRLFVSEPYPDGLEMYFDYDIFEYPAVVLGKDGASRFVVCRAKRVHLPEFEISIAAYIPYSELRTRKYLVFDRAKQRLQQAVWLAEDYRAFGLIHDATVLNNLEFQSTTPLTQAALALSIKEIEKHRLLGVNILMGPDTVAAMRMWRRDQIDEVARIELRRTGFLGNLWGANFFYSNLIKPLNETCYAYILTEPSLFGWIPMRVRAELIPSNRPDDRILGFVSYSLLGMMVFNAYGVARVSFPENTPFVSEYASVTP